MTRWKIWARCIGSPAWAMAFLGVSAGVLVPFTLAQDPKTANSTTPSFEDWIKKLGDPHFRQRELATQTLRTAGSKALDSLKKSLSDPDPEIRNRVTELVSDIEASIQMEPKRVTLKEIDKPVKDIIATLGKTSGYPIDLWNNPGQNITIQCADKPFWEVIDEISEKAGLTLQQNYGDERVRLNQTGFPPRFVNYSGPFRITAQSIQQHKVVDLASSKEARRTETLSLQLVVFSEPRMPILGLGEAKLTSALDSDGNSLIPPNINPDGTNMPFRGRSVSRYGNGYRMLSMQSSVNLRRVNEKAKEATIIKGSLPATLLAQQERAVLSKDILSEKGKKLETSNMTFQVDQVGALPNGGLELKMTITDKSKDPSDMTWMNSLMQRIEVRDPKDNKLNPSGTNWHHSGQNFVQISFSFQPTAAKVEKNAKYQLIFQNWKTLDHIVSFELRNIPLP